MANIEKNEGGHNVINVTESVGYTGVNEIGDVMVVQAMLRYLKRSEAVWTTAPLPEPNGILDEGTQQAIFDYQQWVRTRSQRDLTFWIAKDGAVLPYKKDLKLLHKQEWTIISMNRDCATLSALLHDGKDHIEAINSLWPLITGHTVGRIDQHRFSPFPLGITP